MGSREMGTVTAEAALVLPALVLVAVALAWLVGLGVNHARAVDAAREAARVVARGESVGEGVRLARRVAPPGARIGVRAGSSWVVVDVSAPVRPPGGVLGGLGAVTVHARAVAATEPSAALP
ncbi:pilus assembly protein [Nocardioides mangrovicus]|uniref:Pilus assembly protein n=1 Tax=Nocardioides mangrovicus TaxID=2478913 RepID=A0A3L8P054_9ACTN|nr:TadE family type IV pilus minor pilin [Nocardioides mangrovicus]RLV48282.1 pilus assembly protein [Nocardioides mangrovicus]